MKIKRLYKKEIDFIYKKYVVNHFDEDELRPLKSIKYLYKKKLYKCFKAVVDNVTVGYAFFYVNGDDILLDYFGIIDKYRSKGYGSLFLRKILKKLNKKTIYIEVEDPDFSINEEDRFIRERRINFYSRNGVFLSDLKVLLFDVNYRIMTSKTNDYETTKNHFLNMYISMMPLRNFEKNVVVY